MGVRSLVRVAATGASVVALLASASAASAHWAGVHSAGASARQAGVSSTHASARAFHSTAGPVHSDDVMLSSPICTIVGNGKPGAAVGMLPTDNPDSLNILAFGLSSDAKQITAQLKVSNLTDGPGGGPNLIGTGDDWYVLFSYKSATYYLHANYGGAINSSNGSASQSLWNFYYGRQFTLPVLGVQSQDDGSAAGGIDPAYGVITITVPFSAFGTTFDPSQVEPVGPIPTLGGQLKALSAVSYYEQGTPAVSGPASQAFINASDTLAADPKVTYTVGTTC